ATLAGVLLALTVPLRTGTTVRQSDKAPLIALEHALHPWVNFLIIPVFGFANAGISFAGMNIAAVIEPVPLGVALGLFAGKQLGVFFTALLVVRAGLAHLPEQASWRQLYGVASL